MKYYELTYLVSTRVSETELKNLQEKINSFIQQEEGILIETKNLGQQKLAYPIKKENEAYLVSLSFHFKPEKLKRLEKQLKEIKEILRFLILTKQLTKAKTITREVLPKIKKLPPKEKKVELKEIEKKLEEILNES